jgi:regulator of replication initiation timing
MQQLYTSEKIFRVIQPNNSMSEYIVNKRLVDDKAQEIKVINDMTIGKYDVIVVAGSTLPSNRYAELEFYMDAYAKGLVDRQEVLKKTEVFDMEGVMQRMDAIAQLQQQLQQAGDQIKKLKGDLQTRDRESVNLRKKVEVEKFKTGLDKTQNKASAAASVFEKRLNDEDKNIRTQIQSAAKSASK